MEDIRTKKEWTQYKNNNRMSITVNDYVKLVVFSRRVGCQARDVQLSDVLRGPLSELDVYNTYGIYNI